MATHRGRLEGKVALVSRGGYGFGAGIVDKFVEEGAQVLVMDHSVTNGTEVAQAHGKGKAAFCHADATKEEDWKKAVEACIKAFGKVDMVVNHAGAVHRMLPSIEVPEPDLDRVITANIKTIYHSVRAVVPHFLSRAEKANPPNGHPTPSTPQCHGCSILNISSISAPRPRPGLVFYAGTKSAASAITKGLAAEYAPVGIRVNAVEPVAGDSALVPPRYALAGNIGGKARAPSLIGGMLSPGEDATTPAVSGQMSASLGRSKSGELDAPGQSQTLSKSRATSFGSTGSATSSIGATSSQAVVSQGIPLGRWATARDVANAAAFLCSDEADFITGVCLRVDGGRSLN